MNDEIFSDSSIIDRGTLLAYLGLSLNATEDQITTEYRKRVLSCHPDLHIGDTAKEEEFKKVSVVYARLMNKEINYAQKEEVESWREVMLRDEKKSPALQAAARELALRRAQNELKNRMK